MLIKLIYVLFFALSNFVIYSLLHKTGKVNLYFILGFSALFVFAVLLHIGSSNANYLMPKDDFFGSIFFLLFPITAFIWFKFALKRINRLKERGVNKSFVNGGIKIFSFFFLKVTFVMAFICQCSLIFCSHCDL